MRNLSKKTTAFLLIAAVATLSAGCTDQGKDPGGDSTSVTKNSGDDPSHGGWWCVEHAIPEEECSMCSASYAKACKEKGDWCEEHNRAESQCFICDASQAEKYVKLYEAKYGKKPPAATE